MFTHSPEQKVDGGNASTKAVPINGDAECGQMEAGVGEEQAKRQTRRALWSASDYSTFSTTGLLSFDQLLIFFYFFFFS